MKTKHYILAICALSITVFASCKKDKDEPQINPKEVLLTAHTWKIASITIPAANEEEGVTEITTECSLLATVDFNSAHTFVIADTEKNCDSTIVPYSNGTWSLSAADDILSLKGEKEMSWNITELTDSELKATFRDSISPENIRLKTITLKK